MYNHNASRVMTMVPASFKPRWCMTVAPVGTDIPVAIGVAAVALPVPVFPAFEFTVHLVVSRVPLVLVVLGTPITVGLVPVGSQSLAGSGEKDRCHENA